uniref:NADH:ubiquinone reductase (H(+)-translocating) n=1 Tax=Alaria americana TaxID=2282137 RepID=A0A6J3YMK0_9TREM|nr:NADH dehydrogenase subunit 5 [Alaria americana]
MFISLVGCFLVGFMVIGAVYIWGSSLSFSISLFPCSFSLGNTYEFVGCFDYIMALCLLMLFICSWLAFVYCFHYYYGSSDAIPLFYLMVWFVCIMLMLMITGSVIFTLVLWEYLGFVSFLLILFYSNSSSIRASLMTLFSSRFGDVGLFVVLVYLMCGGSVLSSSFFFAFFLVVMSKSAGFPFISWLLEAMRAPTPVSSLVHSSTLVAAGVWFMVRYGFVLSSGCVFYIFVVSLFTIFVTGVCALFFFDLKKIVALSTCNNVAWCLLYYICGDLGLVMFQLLVHGVCKCSLFMLVGDLMSSSGGSQSSVGVYMSRYGGVYGNVLLVFLVFCLCGVPFLGIYFSKHFFFLLLVGGSYNVFLVSLVLVGFFISYVYSFRLSLMVCSGVRGISLGYLVSFLFVSFFVLVGTMFGWLVFGQFEEYSCLSFFWSLLFLFIQVCGCVVGYLIYSFSLVGWFWQTMLFGSDSLVGLFYSLYSDLVGFSFLVIYRWEVFFLGQIGRLMSGFSGSFLIFSLNFVIFGMFCYVFFSFVF